MSHPRILGVAGGGLRDASWAANAAVAKVGKAGEQKTAQLLNRFAVPEEGVTVLHDLRIPIPGFSANIDHVVVSGSTIHIIDAKVWKPAFYWTVGGKTRRGWSRFAPADKKTMEMAREHVDRFLQGRGITASFATPVLAIWPSSDRKPIKVGWLSIPGAKAMTGEQFTRYAEKTFAPGSRLRRGGTSADPRIVETLAALLVTPPRQQTQYASTGTDPW